MLPSRIERDERAALGLERLHRAAAARAVDQADDRQPELARHSLRVHLLLEDRRVGGAAAHREVVAGHDDRSAVDAAPPHHEVRGRHVDDVAVVVVGGAAGERADLVEGSGIEQRVDAFAHGQLALRVVLGDLLVAAHPPRERAAARELVELGFPAAHELTAGSGPTRQTGRLPVAPFVVP